MNCITIVHRGLEFKKEPYQCPERGHDGACWGVNAALFVNQEQAFSQLVQA